MRSAFVRTATRCAVASRSALVVAALALSAAGATAQTATVTVSGTADPYLAGMPVGSTASGGNDVAPAQSPVLVTGLTLVPGSALRFTATGSTSCGSGCVTFGPEGAPTDLIAHAAGAQNGISDVTMPVSALLGVFLDANSPAGLAAPGALDFSTAASRDFASLSPLLRQVFFIGDGRTSANVGQQFIIPTGATRLFLGTMDGYDWYNNTGELAVTVSAGRVGSTVPEPATVVLVAAGLCGAGALARRRARTG